MNRLEMLPYLAIALAIMFPLLGPGYYLSLDFQFGPSAASDFQFGDFYGHGPSPYGPYYVLRFIFAAFSQFIPMEIIEKGFLLAILFLCGAGAHQSLPKELGNSRYFAGLMYMLNPFVFVRFLAGHVTILLSYAIWPLAFKFFWDFLRNPQDRNALAKSALITMCLAISSHGLFMALMGYLFIFIFHLAYSSGRITVMKRTLALGLLVIILNLFWVVPSLLLYRQLYQPAAAEDYLADFGARGGGLPVDIAVLTLHGFWRGGFTLTKDVFSYWLAPFILISALAIFGFHSLLRHDRPQALALLAVFLVSFMIALGDKGPAQWFFTLLGEDFPLYLFFRDSQKFAGLLALAYSILGAYGVDEAARRLPRHGNMIAALLLALPVIYNYGFFGFIGQIGPTVFPDDWKEADKIVSADPAESSVLVLPPYLYYQYPWVNSTQKTLGSPASVFFSKPVITGQNAITERIAADVKDPRTRLLSVILERRESINNTAELLLPLNARYVLLLKNDMQTTGYLELLRKDADMEPAFESDSLYLFRNTLVRGPFIASKENGTGGLLQLQNFSGRGLFSANVSYARITPSLYYIESSPYPYVVMALVPNGAAEFDSAPLYSWHNIGSGFDFPGPGKVSFTYFTYILAFFLLSWAIAVMLISGTPRAGIIIAPVFAVLYYLIYGGMLGPAGIGSALIVSLALAFIYKCFMMPKTGKSAKPF
jgi:hypothetical protein